MHPTQSFYQYIADKILSINESGHYRPISQLDEQTKLSQDDEIFQRARLVNCGFFMQIILSDYVAAILGLVRDGITWRLDPRTVRREKCYLIFVLIVGTRLFANRATMYLRRAAATFAPSSSTFSTDGTLRYLKRTPPGLNQDSQAF